jgi:hypothetical protein
MWSFRDARTSSTDDYSYPEWRVDVSVPQSSDETQLRLHVHRLGAARRRTHITGGMDDITPLRAQITWLRWLVELGYLATAGEE